MTIETQVVPIVMGQGINTKSNDRVGVPGKLVALNNAVFTTTERISKRPGGTSLGVAIKSGATTSGNIGAGAMLATRGTELLEGDGASLYSYDGASSYPWTNKGTLLGITARTSAMAQSGYSVGGYDCALHSSGLMIMAVELWAPLFSWTRVGLYYQIVDTTTGNIIQPLTLISATGYSPKCSVTGSNLEVYYVDGSPVVIKGGFVQYFTPTATFTSSTYVASGGGSASLSTTIQSFDVLTLGTSTVYIAFVNNAGTNGTTINYYAGTSTVVTSRVCGGLGAASKAVGIVRQPFNGDILVGSVLVADVAFNAFGALLASVGTTGTMATKADGFSGVCGVGSSTNSTSQWYFSYYAGNTLEQDRIDQVTVSGSAPYTFGSQTVFLRGCQPAAKPYAYSGTYYLPISLMAGSQAGGYQIGPIGTMFVANASGTIVARLLPGTFAGNIVSANTFNSGVRPQSFPSVWPSGSSTFYIPAGQVVQFSQAVFSGTPSTQLNQRVAETVLSLNMADPTYALQTSEIAGSTQIATAAMQQYDGQQLVELGFNYPPYALSNSISGVGGFIAPGTYQYAACYEWTDGQNRIHRSAPSVALSVINTGASTNTNTLTIPTHRLTSKSIVRIVVYRTQANGTVFYQINNTGSVSDALLNDTTVNSVTWADTLADTSIASNAQLYTTGGVLQNDPPPPLISPVIHRNRVIGIDSTNPLTLWYSKQVGPAAPVEFSGFLTLNEDPRGGPCTALASLDDKLIVFKADRVFMHTGQGPDSTGGQNDWSDAILISSDVGCTAPKSIVVTPMGLMFQSAKGIYLINRSLQCQYIGSDVEVYNGSAVLSAQLVGNTNQVRFQQAARTIVYDYFVDQWSVFTYPGTGAASVMLNGVYNYLRSDGLVFAEVAGQYADIVSGVSTFVALGFTTSWLSFAGLQGFQRVRRLLLEGGKATGAAGENAMTLTIYSNFAMANSQTVSFTTTSIAGNDEIEWQERIHITQQKSESMQIVFLETQNASLTDNYMDLTAMSLEVGVKRGAFKLPAAQSTG